MPAWSQRWTGAVGDSLEVMKNVRQNPWQAVGVLGIVLVAVGALLVVRGSAPRTFGWSAYAPLSETTFSPGVQVLSTQMLWGLGVGAAGLVVLAASVAYALGVRRGRDEGLPGRV